MTVKSVKPWQSVASRHRFDAEYALHSSPIHRLLLTGSPGLRLDMLQVPLCNASRSEGMRKAHALLSKRNTGETCHSSSRRDAH